MAAAPADKCPYLGPEAFTEDKEHLFFGAMTLPTRFSIKRSDKTSSLWLARLLRQIVRRPGGLFARLRRDAQKWENHPFPPREDRLEPGCGVRLALAAACQFTQLILTRRRNWPPS